MSTRGQVVVLSGPSSAGKHTILHRLLDADAQMDHSISATTRAPRKGEVDGKDYYFLARDEFERRAAAGEFVEWAHVHDNLYGTLRSELERHVATGKDVVLQLDVQGMRNLRRTGIAMTAIFVMPPSFEELERRIRARATDDEPAIALRLRNAREEMCAKDDYDYVVVNDEIEEAVAECAAIIRARRAMRQEQGAE